MLKVFCSSSSFIRHIPFVLYSTFIEVSCILFEFSFELQFGSELLFVLRERRGDFDHCFVVESVFCSDEKGEEWEEELILGARVKYMYQ